MDIAESIGQRKSIRAFKPDPVPKGILQEIMGLALRAPSWANTQPWQFALVGGDTLEEIRKGFIEKVQAGEIMSPDLAPPKGYPEPYDTRRRGVGRKLFETMNTVLELTFQLKPSP